MRIERVRPAISFWRVGEFGWGETTTLPASKPIDRESPPRSNSLVGLTILIGRHFRPTVEEPINPTV